MHVRPLAQTEREETAGVADRNADPARKLIAGILKMAFRKSADEAACIYTASAGTARGMCVGANSVPPIIYASNAAGVFGFATTPRRNHF
jgi:hypothetical protein